MREEAERVVAAEGWTKSALGKQYPIFYSFVPPSSDPARPLGNMVKIDSFLRESQRVHGSGAGACSPSYRYMNTTPC